MQENHTLGSMEETTLDFENLVLGKKSPPTNNNISNMSPPIAAFQQGFNRSQPSIPMNVMTPMQPISQTPPPQPPSSSTFFQPLQPSPYTAPSSARNGPFTSPSTAFSATGSGFSANTNWSNPSLNSVPTIAPPPAKANQLNIGFSPQQAKPADGLEKYQSLL